MYECVLGYIPLTLRTRVLESDLLIPVIKHVPGQVRSEQMAKRAERAEREPDVLPAPGRLPAPGCPEVRR
jgi:hypothetical protein